MNKKEIEDFIKFVAKAEVSEVSLETKEIKITIKNTPKHGEHIITHASAPALHTHAVPLTTPHAAASKTETSSAKTQAETGADASKFHIIKSPMIGTFYRTPSPDKPNFINVGDEVKPGKIICIIEAMKLFNEIECDVSGKIVKVLVENASPVEYDQPLFLVEPS